MMLHRYKQSRRQHHHRHQQQQRHQHDRSSSSFPSSTATACFGSRHGQQNDLKLLRLQQDQQQQQQQGGRHVLDVPVGLNHVQHSSTSIRGCGMLPVEGSDVLAPLGSDVPTGTPVATDRTTTTTTCSHRLDSTCVDNVAATTTATTAPTTSNDHTSMLKESKATTTTIRKHSATTTATASSTSQTLSEAARSLSAEDYLDSYEEFWNIKNTNSDSNNSTQKNDKSSSRLHLQQQHKKKKKIGEDCCGNYSGDSSSDSINSNHNTINVEVIDLTMEDDDDDDQAVKTSHPGRHPIISVGDHDKNGSSIRISHNLLRGAIFLSNSNGKSSSVEVESCGTSTPKALATGYPPSTSTVGATPNNENAARQSSHKIKKSVRRVSFGGIAVATNSSKGFECTATLRASSTMKQPPESSAAATATESSSMPTISSSRGRRNHHRGGGGSRPGCTTRTMEEVGLIVPYSLPAQQYHHSDATSVASMATVTAAAPYPYPYGLSGYYQHDQYQYQQHQQPSSPYYDGSSQCHLPCNYGGTLDATPTAQFYHGYNNHNHERSMLASSMSRTMLTTISSSSVSPYAPSQHFYPMTSHPALSNEQRHGHGSGQGSFYAREYCVSTNSSNHHDSSTSAAMAGAPGGSGMGLELLQSSGYHHPILTSTSLDATTAILATPTTILTTAPSSSSRRGSMSSNISSLTHDSSTGVGGTGCDLDLDRNRATMSGTSSKTGIKISPVAERSMATKKIKNRISSNSDSEIQEQVPIHLERDDEPESITTSQSHHKAPFPTKPTWKESEASSSDKQPQEPALLLPPQQQRTIASVDNEKHNHKMSSTISTSSRSTTVAAQGMSVPSSSSSLILSKSSSSQPVPRDLSTSDRPEKRHDHQDIGDTATKMIASAATTPTVETMKKKKAKIIEKKKTKEIVVTVTKKPLKKSKKKLNNVEHTNKKKDKTVVATKMSSKKVKKKLKNGQNKEIKKHIITKLSVSSSASSNHDVQQGMVGGTKTDRSCTLRDDQSHQTKPSVLVPPAPPQPSQLSSSTLSFLAAAEKNMLKPAPLSTLTTKNDPPPAAQLQPPLASSLSPTSTAQKKKVFRINFVKKINRLVHPTDCLNLNSLHCFVRQELLDVFVLSPGSSDLKDVTPRVGLRCTYCGHLSKSKREKGMNGVSGCHKMSSFYPKSIEDLYRSVCSWQRVHFPNCPYVPDDIKSKYSLLKQQDLSHGKTRHWEHTARLMGLRNASDSDRQGIIYRPSKNKKMTTTTSGQSKSNTTIEPSNNSTPTVLTITTKSDL